MDETAHHYDRVTEVWRRWIMGDDLHFGLFRTPDDTLRQATQNLTDLLIHAANLEPDLDVLDVGCGVGTPAVRLASRERCRVTGITTSPVGLDQARARIGPHGDRLRFELANAMQTGFPASTFDRVFSLESAHLMTDHPALFRECYRVLRPGGRLALCDVVQVTDLEKRIPEIEGYRALGHSRPVAQRMLKAVHRPFRQVFACVGFTDAALYRDAAQAAGFAQVSVENISLATRPTLEHWGRNADTHAEHIEAVLGRAYLEDLFLALLHMSLGWNRVGGYVVLTAVKP